MSMKCETCQGWGEIEVGWRTMADGCDEPVMDECPICLGHGEVKPWELEEFGGAFPDVRDAAAIVLERFEERRRTAHAREFS